MVSIKDVHYFEDEDNFDGLIDAVTDKDRNVRNSAAEALGRIIGKNPDLNRLEAMNEYRLIIKGLIEAKLKIDEQNFAALQKLSIIPPENILKNGYPEDFVESLRRKDINLQNLYEKFYAINPPAGFEKCHNLYLKHIEYLILNHEYDVKYYASTRETNEDSDLLNNKAKYLNQKALEIGMIAYQEFFRAALR
jgi:hypothetical protein